MPPATDAATAHRIDSDDAGFFADLIAGLVLWHAWLTKGWYDIVLRYRRTVIGPFWMVLSTALMIACLSLIAPALFGGSSTDLLPYLAVGIVSWNFIAITIGELSGTFIEQASDIRAVKLPFSIYIYRVILRNLVGYAHLLFIYFLIALIFAIPSIPYLPLFVLGLVLIVLNFVWIGFCLGIASARFRDIQQVVASILTIGFLLTPVFWDKTILLGRGARSLVIYLNPLAHMLELLRAPLLAQVPDAQHYLFLLISLGVGSLGTALLYRRQMRRTVFWL